MDHTIHNSLNTFVLPIDPSWSMVQNDMNDNKSIISREKKSFDSKGKYGHMQYAVKSILLH